MKFYTKLFVPVALISFVVFVNFSRYTEYFLQKYDICFQENHPGAGDRFTTFTPVKCSNPTVYLGPEVGADRAELSFAIGDNGTPEYIVQSSEFWCKFYPNGCFDAMRIVVRVQLNDPPTFTIIEEKPLPLASK